MLPTDCDAISGSPEGMAEPASLALDTAEISDMTNRKTRAADVWINEIKILIADGQSIKAKQEYELFQQHFPEEAKQYKPDFSRKIVDIFDENPNPR